MEEKGWQMIWDETWNEMDEQVELVLMELKEKLDGINLRLELRISCKGFYTNLGKIREILGWF